MSEARFRLQGAQEAQFVLFFTVSPVMFAMDNTSGDDCEPAAPRTRGLRREARADGNTTDARGALGA